MIFSKKYHNIYKKPQTNYPYENIFGDVTIFVKDEKFRNLFANFIVIKDDNFSDLQAKLIHLNEIWGDDEKLDEEEFTRRMDNFKLKWEVNSALVYAYVDHDEGLSFQTVAPSYLEGDKLKVYERLDDFNINLDNKWEAVEDLEFHYLSDLNVDSNLDIKEYESNAKEKLILSKDDEKILYLRMLKDLDEFRNEEYPDDILVFFFKEGFNAEGMWVRYEDINENHEIFGKLLNQPNQNLGVNKGDEVKFSIINEENDLFCCCDLDE